MSEKKRASGICVFDFTVWDNVADFDAMKELMTETSKHWVFQQESCPSTGSLHWQGRVSLKVAVRPGVALSVFNRILGKGFGKLMPTHEVAAAEMMMRGKAFYCTKEESRVRGPWSDKDEVPEEEPWHLAQYETMLPWQKSVIESLKVRDERCINVIIDEAGCQGKSILAGKIRFNKLGRVLPPLNDWQDLMAFVCDTRMAETKKGINVQAYVIDVPRGFNQKKMTPFWTAIESIKGGYAFDKRYHTKEVIFGAPVIWVFMNEKPVTPMTNDRWKYWCILGGKLHQGFPLPQREEDQLPDNGIVDLWTPDPFYTGAALCVPDE
jgi:hypothetical protein